MNSSPFPPTRNISTSYSLSLIVAFFMTAASLISLLFPSTMYPNEDLRQSFIPNDVANLFIGLPILLGSMWLARRGKLIGLLFWPAHCSISYTITLPIPSPCHSPCCSSRTWYCWS